MADSAMTAADWLRVGEELRTGSTASLTSTVGTRSPFTAAQALLRAVQLEPSMYYAWSSLSESIPRLQEVAIDGIVINRTQCCVRAVEAALSADPPPPPPVSSALWMTLGASLPVGSGETVTVDGKQFTAADCYVTAIAYGSSNADAWLNLAQELLDLLSPTPLTVTIQSGAASTEVNAQTAAQRCVELAPQDADGWWLLAKALDRGPPEQAKAVVHGHEFDAGQCFGISVQLKPHKALFWRSLVQHFRGHPEAKVQFGDDYLTNDNVVSVALANNPMDTFLWHTALVSFKNADLTARLPKVDLAAGAFVAFTQLNEFQCAEMVIVTGEPALQTTGRPSKQWSDLAIIVANSWKFIGGMHTLPEPFTVGPHTGVTLLECYRRALDLQPNFGMCWVNLGVMLDPSSATSSVTLLNGETVNRIECYQRAVSRWKLQPGAPLNGLEIAWVNLGGNLNSPSVTINGRRLTRMDCVVEALRVNVRHAPAWRVLGDMLGDSAQTLRLPWTDAPDDWRLTVATSSVCFARAVSLIPGEPILWQELGRSLQDEEVISLALFAADGSCPETKYTKEDCFQIAAGIHHERERQQKAAQSPQQQQQRQQPATPPNPDDTPGEEWATASSQSEEATAERVPRARRLRKRQRTGDRVRRK